MQLFDKQQLYESNRIRYISVSAIRPNPNQPRKYFEEKNIAELADSIRQFGIIQPLTVRRVDGCYELVAGERRLRAAKMVSLDKVPCILIGVEESGSNLIALIENLQRRDLGYIEEADGILRLINTYGLTQEEAARRLGKSQSSVANKLRILKHSPQIIDLLRKHDLTERYARALLRINREQDKLKMISVIVKRKLNVAQTEMLIDKVKEETEKERRLSKKKYIIKDVRMFVNTVQNALSLIQKAGVTADMVKNESDETITLTIVIPK